MTDPAPLKLRARAGEDLALISGLCQDALVRASEMTYEAGNKRFVCVFNRFCWERDGALDDQGEAGADLALAAEDKEPGAFHRTHTGLVIDKVTSVQSRDVDLDDGKTLLNLLALETDGTHLMLSFSGGGSIRLKISGLLAHMSDLGDPWPTQWRPHHGHDEEILAQESGRDAAAG